MHNGKKFWLQFSEERKSVLKKLLENKAHIVDFVAKQIKDKVDEINNSLDAADHSLFSADGILNADKILHISNYPNGVVRFSEPAFLNDNVNDEKFQQLFSLLIDKHQQKLKPTADEEDIIMNPQKPIQKNTGPVNRCEIPCSKNYFYR